MANWRQIQARIRKAKNSPEAPTKLADLYNKTRDPMVAFELATIEEKAASISEAVRWYTTAAERFRRADWKTRAEEALTRLGAPIPAPRVKGERKQADESDELPDAIGASTVRKSATDQGDDQGDDQENIGNRAPARRGAGPAAGQILVEEQGEEDEHEVDETSVKGNLAPPQTTAGNAAQPTNTEQRKRGRRGRRGGRGRRRGAGGPALPAETFASSASSSSRGSRGEAVRGRSARPSSISRPQTARPQSASTQTVAAHAGLEPPSEYERSPADSPVPSSRPLSTSRIDARSTRDTHGDSPAALPSERVVVHGRGREPAIASRLAHLESLLRRLLGSQLHALDSADEAPAGPGVLLLSDSELVDSYYVESCQTLRVALGQLVRGGRIQRRDQGGESLKERLAEHLGISENKVADYLKKHCVVRWIQLDDEAHHLAHFAVGVLRTPLNQT